MKGQNACLFVSMYVFTWICPHTCIMFGCGGMCTCVHTCFCVQVYICIVCVGVHRCVPIFVCVHMDIDCTFYVYCVYIHACVYVAMCLCVGERLWARSWGPSRVCFVCTSGRALSRAELELSFVRITEAVLGRMAFQREGDRPETHWPRL